MSRLETLLDSPCSLLGDAGGATNEDGQTAAFATLGDLRRSNAVVYGEQGRTSGEGVTWYSRIWRCFVLPLYVAL